MKTKIFAAFPETGKTYATRMHPGKVKELNSKFYYYSEDHEYLFDSMFVRDLKQLIGKVDIILIDTNTQILNRLFVEKIEFEFILPDEELLEQLMIDHNEYERKMLYKHYSKLLGATVINRRFIHKGESVNIYLKKNNLV